MIEIDQNWYLSCVLQALLARICLSKDSVFFKEIAKYYKANWSDWYMVILLCQTYNLNLGLGLSSKAGIHSIKNIFSVFQTILVLKKQAKNTAKYS